jgi:hypothetical protein
MWLHLPFPFYIFSFASLLYSTPHHNKKGKRIKLLPKQCAFVHEGRTFIATDFGNYHLQKT